MGIALQRRKPTKNDDDDDDDFETQGDLIEVAGLFCHGLVAQKDIGLENVLQVGHVVVKVNGQPCPRNPEEASKLLEESFPLVSLECVSPEKIRASVFRTSSTENVPARAYDPTLKNSNSEGMRRLSSPTLAASDAEQSYCYEAVIATSTVITAEVIKPTKDTRTGLYVRKSNKINSIIIASLSPKGLFAAAASSRDLQVGQKILKINGQPCPTDAEDVIQIIKDTVGLLRVEAAEVDWGATLMQEPRHVVDASSTSKNLAAASTSRPTNTQNTGSTSRAAPTKKNSRGITEPDPQEYVKGSARQQLRQVKDFTTKVSQHHATSNVYDNEANGVKNKHNALDDTIISLLTDDSKLDETIQELATAGSGLESDSISQRHEASSAVQKREGRGSFGYNDSSHASETDDDDEIRIIMNQALADAETDDDSELPTGPSLTDMVGNFETQMRGVYKDLIDEESTIGESDNPPTPQRQAAAPVAATATSFSSSSPSTSRPVTSERVVYVEGSVETTDENGNGITSSPFDHGSDGNLLNHPAFYAGMNSNRDDTDSVRDYASSYAETDSFHSARCMETDDDDSMHHSYLDNPFSDYGDDDDDDDLNVMGTWSDKNEGGAGEIENVVAIEFSTRQSPQKNIKSNIISTTSTIPASMTTTTTTTSTTAPRPQPQQQGFRNPSLFHFYNTAGGQSKNAMKRIQRATQNSNNNNTNNNQNSNNTNSNNTTTATTNKSSSTLGYF